MALQNGSIMVQNNLRYSTFLLTWHCWRGPAHSAQEESPGKPWHAAGQGRLPADCPQFPQAHAAPRPSVVLSLPHSMSSSAQPPTAAPQL